MRREPVFDALGAQDPFRRRQEAHQFEPVADVEAQVPGVEDAAVPVDQPRVRVRAVLLVERPHLVLNGLRGIVEGRDALQHVPETDVGLFREHAAAARDVPSHRISRPVERAAGDRLFLDDADVAAPEAAVADQQYGRGQ